MDVVILVKGININKHGQVRQWLIFDFVFEGKKLWVKGRIRSSWFLRIFKYMDDGLFYIRLDYVRVNQKQEKNYYENTKKPATIDSFIDTKLFFALRRGDFNPWYLVPMCKKLFVVHLNLKETTMKKNIRTHTYIHVGHIEQLLY